MRESWALFCCLIIKIRRWLFKMVRGCLLFNSRHFSFIYNLRFSGASFHQFPSQLSGGFLAQVASGEDVTTVFSPRLALCLSGCSHSETTSCSWILTWWRSFSEQRRELTGLLSWTCYTLLGHHVITGKLNEKMSAWINKLIREWAALLENVKVIWKKSNVSVSVLLSQWTSAFSVGIPVCLLFRWLLLIHSFIHPAWEFSACSLWLSAHPFSFAQQMEEEVGWVLETAKEFSSLQPTYSPALWNLPSLALVPPGFGETSQGPFLAAALLHRAMPLHLLSSRNLRHTASCWFPSYDRSLIVVGLFF